MWQLLSRDLVNFVKKLMSIPRKISRGPENALDRNLPVFVDCPLPGGTKSDIEKAINEHKKRNDILLEK